MLLPHSRLQRRRPRTQAGGEDSNCWQQPTQRRSKQKWRDGASGHLNELEVAGVLGMPSRKSNQPERKRHGGRVERAQANHACPLVRHQSRFLLALHDLDFCGHDSEYKKEKEKRKKFLEFARCDFCRHILTQRDGHRCRRLPRQGPQVYSDGPAGARMYMCMYRRAQACHVYTIHACTTPPHTTSLMPSPTKDPQHQWAYTCMYTSVSAQQ